MTQRMSLIVDANFSNLALSVQQISSPKYNTHFLYYVFCGVKS